MTCLLLPLLESITNKYDATYLVNKYDDGGGYSGGDDGGATTVPQGAKKRGRPLGSKNKKTNTKGDQSTTPTQESVVSTLQPQANVLKPHSYMHPYATTFPYQHPPPYLYSPHPYMHPYQQPLAMDPHTTSYLSMQQPGTVPTSWTNMLASMETGVDESMIPRQEH